MTGPPDTANGSRQEQEGEQRQEGESDSDLDVADRHREEEGEQQHEDQGSSSAAKRKPATRAAPLTNCEQLRDNADAIAQWVAGLPELYHRGNKLYTDKVRKDALYAVHAESLKIPSKYLCNTMW